MFLTKVNEHLTKQIKTKDIITEVLIQVNCPKTIGKLIHICNFISNGAFVILWDRQ